MEDKDVWVNALAAAEHHARLALEGRGCGHDFFHADRVRRNALKLQSVEGGDARIIELAALLHDVADPKLVPDAKKAEEDLEGFLRGLDLDRDAVDHTLRILAGLSFGRELSGAASAKSVEFQIVQDADRLEAIGAIGIARCFAYGGSVNQPLYDPEIPQRTVMTAQEYRSGKSSSLNHFAEKLFLLKDRMNTGAAKRWAEERHAFTVAFRTRFLAEWGGADFPDRA
jgi:uncharacterized protein